MSRVATDASRLFQELEFLLPLIDQENGAFNIDMEDETVSGTLVTRGGEIVHPMLTDAPEPAAEVAEEPADTPDEEVAAIAD